MCHFTHYDITVNEDPLFMYYTHVNDNEEQEVPISSVVERSSHRESLPVMMELSYQDENGDQSFNEPANTLPIAGHHSAYPYQLMKSSTSTV